MYALVRRPTSLLQPFRVPQRIQSVICRATSWAHTREHDNFSVDSCHEGFSQHHGELRRPKRHMLPLTCLAFLCIDGPHTLLEPEKTLVDLGALHLPVFVVSHAVGCSLTPSQVHKQQLATLFLPFLLYLDLADCMRPRRRIVRVSSMRGPNLISLFNQVQNFLLRSNKLLFEPSNLDLLKLIL